MTPTRPQPVGLAAKPGSTRPPGVTRLRRLGCRAAACLLGIAFPLRADGDSVVTNETDLFVLDTRCLSDQVGAGESSVVVESAAFTLDTRLTDAAPSPRAVTSETPVFTLDTRLAMEGITAGLTVVQESNAFLLNTLYPSEMESAAFTLDTRVLAVQLSAGDRAVVAESDVFTLDTRVLSEQPGATVVAESGAFTLDTRVLSEQTGAGVAVESGVFTLDTRIQTNPDADGDGIPDAWEGEVFGSTAIAGRGTDFDGDGTPDGDERVAGTDAKNRADSLALRQFSVSGEGGGTLRAVVGWSSASNRVYDLCRGPCGVQNLTAITTNILATPPLNVVTDHVSAAQGQWYRVRVREP